MLDLKPSIGVGVGDLQIAALREARRIMRKAHGDRQVAAEVLLERLQELNLISEPELKRMKRITGLGFDTAKGKTSSDTAYNEVRRIYDEMLAEGQASPTALALAAGAAGSYFTLYEANGQTTVIAQQAGANRDWQNMLGNVGGVLGAGFGGAAGAAVGVAIGQVVGKIVDECID